MIRRLPLALLLLVTFRPASGQDCTTTVLVSFYDQLTTAEIQTLKAGDIEARMSGAVLPVLEANRNFSNRRERSTALTNSFSEPGKPV